MTCIYVQTRQRDIEDVCSLLSEHNSYRNIKITRTAGGGPSDRESGWPVFLQYSYSLTTLSLYLILYVIDL